MADEYDLMNIEDPELREFVQENQGKFIIMPFEDFHNMQRILMRSTVHLTLVEMGLKSSSLQSGKIYHTEMIEVIGVRSFNNAVMNGHLRVDKNDPTKRNSKVYAKRGEWERFLKWNINKKF